MRPQAALIVIVSATAVAGLLPARPAGAASCSGYYSNVTPPSAILLWDDFYGTGKIYSIEFRLYIKQVLPREWFDSDPMSALQAGAMGVTTFSWYNALRCKPTGDGRHYEISLRQQNGWCDPRDIPESEPWRCGTSPNSNEAVDSVFAASSTEWGKAVQKCRTLPDRQRGWGGGGCRM